MTTKFGTLCRASGMRQNEIATCLGVSESTLRGWIKGRRDVPPDAMHAIKNIVCDIQSFARDCGSNPDTPISIYPQDLYWVCMGHYHAAIGHALAMHPELELESESE